MNYPKILAIVIILNCVINCQSTDEQEKDYNSERKPEITTHKIPAEKESLLSRILIKARNYAEQAEKYQRENILEYIAVEQAKLDLGEAIYSANMITTPYDGALALISVANVCIDIKDNIGALKVLNMAEERIATIDSEMDSFLKNSGLAHLAKTYAKMGDLQKVQQIGYLLSPSAFFDTDSLMVLEAIAEKQALDGKINEAIKTLSQTNDTMSRSYRAVALKLMNIGAIEDSIKIVKASKNLEDRNSVFASIIENQVAQNMNIAIPLVHEITSYGEKTIAWQSIINELIKTNKTLPEYELKIAIEDVYQCTNPYSKAKALSTISVYTFMQGEKKQSENLISDALEAAHGSISKFSIVIVAQAYVAIGRLQEAKKSISEFPGYQDYVSQSISEHKAKQGHIDEALQVISQMKSRTLKAEALKSVSKILEEYGEKELATKLLKDSAEMFFLMNEVPEYSRFLSDDPMLSSLIHYVKMELLDRHIDSAWSLAKEIHRKYSVHISRWPFALISKYEIERGNFQWIINLIRKERDPVIKSNILLSIVSDVLAVDKSTNWTTSKLYQFLSEIDKQSDDDSLHSLNTLVDNLNNIITKTSSSYCELIWHTTELIQEETLHLEWPLVRSTLEDKGIYIQRERKNEYDTTYWCILKEKAYEATAGHHFDLWIEFDVRIHTSKTFKSKEIVSNVSTMLKATPHISYTKIIQELPYQKMPGIQEVLEGEEIKKSVVDYQILKNIEISSSNFRELVIMMDLVSKDEEGGKRLFCYLILVSENMEENSAINYKAISIKYSGGSTWGE